MATGIRSDGTLLTDQGVRWNHRFDFSPLWDDMSGFDVVAKGRRRYGAADPPLFSLTIGDGITLDGANSLVDVVIDDDDLAAIPPSHHYVWELRILDGSDNGLLSIGNLWLHDPGAIE